MYIFSIENASSFHIKRFVIFSQTLRRFFLGLFAPSRNIVQTHTRKFFHPCKFRLFFGNTKMTDKKNIPQE